MSTIRKKNIGKKCLWGVNISSVLSGENIIVEIGAKIQTTVKCLILFFCQELAEHDILFQQQVKVLLIHHFVTSVQSDNQRFFNAKFTKIIPCQI